MNAVTDVIPVSKKEVEIKESIHINNAFLEGLKKLEITTPEQFTSANALLKKIIEKIKRIDETWGVYQRAAYTAYKGWVDAIKDMKDPLEKANNLLRRSVGVYLAEVKRKEDEERERLRREQEEKRLKEAQVLEDLGKAKEAEKILDKRISISKPEPIVDKGGTFTKTLWRAEITDKMALVKAVAEGKVSPNYLEPNMSLLNSVAKTYKENLNIPGVKAVSEINVSVRG